jgi:hypothetical protein
MLPRLLVSYEYVEVQGLPSLELEHFPQFYQTSLCGGPFPTTLSHFALEETEEEEAVTRWDPYLNPCFEADGVSFSCHVDWVDV